MGKQKKKTMLLFAIVMSTMLLLSLNKTASAKSKVKLSATKKTLEVGQSFTLKLQNNNSKVKWSVSNNKIKITKSNKKQTKIKAVKNGTSTVKAKVGNKTYKCKVTVIDKIGGDGSRKNPYSAYDWHTVNIYNALGENTGKIKIKLLNYMDGDDASKYMERFKEEKGYYFHLDAGEEFVYMEFKIKCTSSQKGLSGANIINAIYNSRANNQLNSGVILGGLLDGMENITDVNLYSGGETTCIALHTVKKDRNYITYNIKTGEDDFTWFTTKK